MRKMNFLAILTVLLSSQIFFSQEPLSLGDVARQIKAEKNGNVPVSTSGAAGTGQQPPTAASASGGPGLTSELDPEKYGTEVSELFAREKFKKLDELAMADRSGKARFPGGGWKLFTLYKALTKPAATEALDVGGNAHLAQLKRWGSAEPNSITAQTALA